jgi:CRP/FNR family transcriptional regulator, cyclic AMP receptor protein
MSIHDYINNITTKFYRRDEIVFNEGDFSNGKMYFIVEGELAVLKKGNEIATLETGSFFGEIAIIKAVPRTTTIKVKSLTAKLGLIDKENFLKISKTAPGFLFILLKTVIERLQKANEVIESLEKKLEEVKR